MLTLGRDLENAIADLAKEVEAKFSESDWKEVAQRVGFRKRLDNHPRLLRSLSWGDNDYAGHVLDMLNEMISADPANLSIIQAKLRGDDSAFLSNDGRYKKGELLGEGGYGQVFREMDTILDMEFARKELSPSAFATDDVIARFLREARILFKLSHPNIISIREVGRNGRNAYIRMDLFEGRRLNEGGQRSPTEAREIVGKIASAMAHAHSRGVIHRDLKPSNVLVLGADVRVIDFGLGAFIEADLNTRLTRSDEAIAGGSYAAPELKDDPKCLDSRSDVYSIGALWSYLVTGRDPSGPDLDARLRTVGDLPDQDQRMILTCMGDLERRPLDGGALFSRIRALNVGSAESGGLEISAPSNELAEGETRVMAAFARAYPFGDLVNADELAQHARAVNLHNDLTFGLALTSLEAKEYVLHSTEDSRRYWSLTATGRNWLKTNGDVLVQLQQDDKENAFPAY